MKSSKMKVSDMTIVLTGASGGIGRAAAVELSQQGARILAVGRNRESLQALISELSGSQHHYFCMDISDAGQRRQLAQQLTALSVPPNILINMAGFGECVLLEEQTPESIEKIININVTSTILLTQALLPLLKRQPAAMIINVGSILGSLGYPGQTVYCASKFALRGFSEALQRELADTSVSIKYFAPRATKTTFNSRQVNALNQRLGNAIDPPEQVAKALVKLITGRRQRYFVGLPERLFIVLNQLFPGVVNRALKKQLPIIKSFATANVGGKSQ